MLRFRPRLALALTTGVAAVAGSMAIAPALAASPSGLAVTFSPGDPVQGSQPINDWRVSVNPGATLTPGTNFSFTLTFGGGTDGTHSVSMPTGTRTIDPSKILVNTTGTASSAGPCPAAGAPGLDNPSNVVSDSVNQKITITVNSTSTAFTAPLEVCISHDAVIGFPLAAGNYSLTYSDNGGSSTASSYAVNSLGNPPTTAMLDIKDVGGTEVSNAGVAGTSNASENVTYNVTLTGKANAPYTITACSASSNSTGGTCVSDSKVTISNANPTQDATGVSTFTIRVGTTATPDHFVLTAATTGTGEGVAATGFTAASSGTGGSPSPSPSSGTPRSPSPTATSPSPTPRASSLAATGAPRSGGSDGNPLAAVLALAGVAVLAVGVTAWVRRFGIGLPRS